MTDCTCTNCVSACKKKPGWMTPDQVQPILDHFKVSNIEPLLGKQLAIDWWVDDNANVLVLAPNITDNGEIHYPGNPLGVCVLLVDDRCSIHSIKPYECRHTYHVNNSDELKRHVVSLWRKSDLLISFRSKMNMQSFGILDYFL